MKLKETQFTLSFSQVVLYVSLWCVGIFHEYLSCLLSLVLLAWLLLRLHRARCLTVSVTLTTVALTTLLVGYAVTPLWAVDSGDAVFGFFKFLPVLLYALVVMQEPDGREQVLTGLPYVMAVTTVVSVVLMHLPFSENYFAVAGRLAGPLQYPNTFAVLLLVAELLLVTRDRLRVWDYGCVGVLLFGILYTGSRTVLILAVLSNVAALLINKNKKVRWIALGSLLLGGLAVVGLCAVTDRMDLIQRYLTISLNSSTFVGRLLYAYDALPVILRHPFGIGYMGYYYMQQSIQSGVYSVLYLHNDFLQFVLDVGWVPGLLLAAAVIRSLFSKTLSLRYKLILLTMVAHACFDFDLQYVAVFMLLILFTDTDSLTKRAWEIRPALCRTVAVVLTALCLFFGSVKVLFRLEKYETVDAIYSAGTLNRIELLKAASTTEEADRIADEIIAHNEYVAVAYSAKARHAYSKGDFARVIQYKNKTMTTAPFATEEYREYAEWLVVGIRLYEQAGDTKSANLCKQELINVDNRLSTLGTKFSNLGKRIDDQPSQFLDKRIRDYVKTVRNEVSG